MIFKNHACLATWVTEMSVLQLIYLFFGLTEISQKMLDATQLSVEQTFWVPRGNELGNSLVFPLEPPCWAANHEISHKHSFSLQKYGQ